MDETRDQRALRASDADREHVADLLRQAASDGRLSLSELDERIDQLYAAKTYGDLEPVVEDLPGILPELPAPARPPTAPESAVVPASTDRVGGVPAGSRRKAVFSGFVQRGEWIVPVHYYVKAVFGGAELDLREAQFEEHEVRIEIKAVFGGVNIVVPDDVHVVVDGDGFFGAFAEEASRRQTAKGAPVVRIGGKAVFGGVNVRRRALGEQ